LYEVSLTGKSVILDKPYSKDLQHFMNTLLRKDPEQRPSIINIFNSDKVLEKTLNVKK